MKPLLGFSHWLHATACAVQRKSCRRRAKSTTASPKRLRRLRSPSGRRGSPRSIAKKSVTEVSFLSNIALALFHFPELIWSLMCYFRVNEEAASEAKMKEPRAS
jgi:hypothetical protein